jgi:hypothetical protein
MPLQKVTKETKRLGLAKKRVSVWGLHLRDSGSKTTPGTA